VRYVLKIINNITTEAKMAQTVTIKDLYVEMEVKNKGVEFEIKIDGKQHRDLIVNKTGLVWCKGKTNAKNGTKKSWSEFTEWIEGK